MTKQTFYVSGMHCAACETVIERTLTKETQAKKVKVSLKNATVDIWVDPQTPALSADTLNTLLKATGYTVFDSKQELLAYSPTSKLRQLAGSFLIAASILFVFFKLDGSSSFSEIALDSSSSYLSYFMFGIAAAFSSCAALVGGIVLTMSKTWTKTTKNMVYPFALFNFGRLGSFLVFGIILGFFGQAVKLSVFSGALVSSLVACFMLIVGLQNLGVNPILALSLPKGLKPILTQPDTAGYSAAFIGAATFFVPCGFTLVAQSTAFSLGNPIKSGLSLLFFALGTLPMLVFISYFSATAYINKRVSKLVSLIFGYLIVVFALYTLNSQLNILGYPSLSDFNVLTYNQDTKDQVKPTFQEGVQVITMVAQGFDYSPKNIVLKRGYPVKILFENKGVYGCAQAVMARGLFSKIYTLEQGLNVIEFTPTTKGKYKITCAMGMVPPVNVEVN